MRVLFRLWIIGTALWTTVFVFVFFGPFGPNLNSLSDSVTGFLVVGVAPPLFVLLLLGLALRWAFSPPHYQP